MKNNVPWHKLMQNVSVSVYVLRYLILGNEMNKIIIKLAVFEDIGWGNMSSMVGFRSVRNDTTNNEDDLIRVSEWKDVEFNAIPVEEVMPEILASLQHEEDIENEKHNIAILNIKRKRQELLAITLQQ